MPLKRKTGGRITHPFGGLRLLSHLSERVRREKILQGESAPPNDGRPEPKRDRPFPIERPVAWGDGFPPTLTRLMRLRDWWLCLWSRIHIMLRKVLLISQDNVIA